MRIPDKVLLLAFFLITSGCSQDKGPDPWMDSGIDSGTDTDTETETESDTGEDETPPDLPSDCSATSVNIGMSGTGDGRTPSVAYNIETLMTWAYDDAGVAVPANWRIQAATFVPDGGVSIQQPMSATIIAREPSMASHANTFGIVWLDSRWDTSCTANLQNNCHLDIAFMRFDPAGIPDDTTPFRITEAANLSTRPAIVGTDDGWLVIWLQPDTTDNGTMMAVALPPTGDPGGSVPTPVQVSQTEGVDIPGLSIAALGTTAVAVWLVPGQQEIMARKLNLDATTSGDAFTIDEGLSVIGPAIVAGSDGFLVSWSRRTFDDFEVYTRMLDEAGSLEGDMNRATWTVDDIIGSQPAWNGSSFALLWLSNRDNGAQDCYDPACENQVFVAELDELGAPRTAAVQLSTNPNPCAFPALSWDGMGWTALWELRQNMRQQIVRGQMTCEL
jgi:hypothetical protein